MAVLGSHIDLGFVEIDDGPDAFQVNGRHAKNDVDLVPRSHVVIAQALGKRDGLGHGLVHLPVARHHRTTTRGRNVFLFAENHEYAPFRG